MGTRKKYIPYDYEAAYTEELRNEEGEQKRKTPPGSIYALKEIRAGSQLEVEIYPEFGRWKDAPPEGRNKKRDIAAQRDLNDRNARKSLERLVNANFGEGDLWITLTYDEEHLPETMEEAIRNMQRYMQRINYQRRKRGMPPAKYIYVTEHSEETAVRWHHHIIMDGAMDRDTVEACWKLKTRNQIRRIVPDEDGLIGMSKYITKDKLKRKRHERRWNASKGLKQPDIRKLHTKKDNPHAKTPKRIRTYVNRILQDREELQAICEKWYPGYVFAEGNVYLNKYNQNYYIACRLRKITKGKTYGKGNKNDLARKNFSASG